MFHEKKTMMITRSSTIPSARSITMSTQKSRRPCGHYLLTTIAICLSLSFLGTSTPYLFANAFSPSSPLAINIVATHFSCTRPPVVMSSKLYAESSSFENDGALPSPSDMRLREIQDELKQRNISYADCFDRESLVKRLIEARDGLVQPSSPPPAPKEDEEPPPASSEPSSSSSDDETKQSSNEPASSDATSSSEEEEFDRQATLTELRSLRIKELKVKLSEQKVRWGTMIEKDEMVQALCDTLEDRFNKSKNFSRSGKLIPGSVEGVDESTLIKELGWLEEDVNRGVVTAASSEDGDVHAPILLDVYATWCGPCQLMAPFLKDAADELGPAARVVKLDSDKYPRISSALKVGGLPTLIRFDGGDISKEAQRIEGALTKDQIIDFVNGNFNR